MLKAVLDLRLLDWIGIEEVSKYIKDPDRLKNVSKNNIEALILKLGKPRLLRRGGVRFLSPGV
ncbi:MAG: hypothetical protein RQ885_15315 [Desulfurococcales archaeon]|jgi:hypothetical protein|nr:hypothetical protein [Desulfurococcales archaeon]